MSRVGELLDRKEVLEELLQKVPEWDVFRVQEVEEKIQWVDDSLELLRVQHQSRKDLLEELLQEAVSRQLPVLELRLLERKVEKVDRVLDRLGR